MTEKQQEILINELKETRDKLDFEIKIIEEKLKVQKEHLSSLNYVLGEFEED